MTTMARRSTKLVSRQQSSGATVWPVTLAQVKDNAQVQHTSDDTLLLDGDNGIVPAAVEFIEEYARVALVTQTRSMTLDDGFPDSETAIELEFPPLQSITSITYLDSDYASQTVSSGDYRVATHGWPGRVILKSTASWPTTVVEAEDVTITFKCGYGDTAASVPVRWKRPIIALATYWWLHRDTYAKREMDAAFTRSLEAMVRTAGGRLRYA